MNRLPVNPLITRGLRIAEEKLGEAELANRLGVAPQVIDNWRLGIESMPQAQFMLLVDVLTGIDPEWRQFGVEPDARQRSVRILVVDDNADAAVTLAYLLQALGHDATAVTDVSVAITVAKQVRPQIAIVDLFMPKMDGTQLARLFRGDDELKHTCLVALTAMDGPQYREMTRQAGFDAHLRKPADAALLRSIIRQFAEAGKFCD